MALSGLELDIDQAGLKLHRDPSASVPSPRIEGGCRHIQLVALLVMYMQGCPG